ncbi:dehydrogenase, partial [Bifidobacterium longum]
MISAPSCTSIGMKVIAYDPYINETAAQELN